MTLSPPVEARRQGFFAASRDAIQTRSAPARSSSMPFCRCPWCRRVDLASKEPAVATLALIGVPRLWLRLALTLGLAALPAIDLGHSVAAAVASPAAGNPATSSPGTAPAWMQRPGASFWDSRPWVYGWYRVQPEVWSWWGPSSSRWALTSLAPAATISGLATAALASGSTVIGVPGGGERLDLASLQPIRPMGVRFRYAAAGEDFRLGNADCQAGLLADLPPQTSQEAQRLNAVCQVTYGNP